MVSKILTLYNNYSLHLKAKKGIKINGYFNFNTIPVCFFFNFFQFNQIENHIFNTDFKNTIDVQNSTILYASNFNIFTIIRKI